MKILHTSDWHLGKKLEGYSRIEEQEKFLEELKEICNREEIQVILIAGDVYDSSNPPVEAEKLYFKAISQSFIKLTKCDEKVFSSQSELTLFNFFELL